MSARSRRAEPGRKGSSRVLRTGCAPGPYLHLSKLQSPKPSRANAPPPQCLQTKDKPRGLQRPVGCSQPSPGSGGQGSSALVIFGRWMGVTKSLACRPRLLPWPLPLLQAPHRMIRPEVGPLSSLPMRLSRVLRTRRTRGRSSEMAGNRRLRFPSAPRIYETPAQASEYPV